MFIPKSVFLATLTLSSCAFALEEISQFPIQDSDIPGKLCKITNPQDPIVPELLKTNTIGLLKFHKFDIDQEPTSEFKQSDYDLLEKMAPLNEQAVLEGKLFLAVLYHQNELFGGSYHTYLNDTKTVFMRGTWFDRDASPARIGAAKQQLIGYMTSRAHFPEAEKMVVCMRDNSKDIPTLTLFGFERDIEFKLPDGAPANIIAFKKAITQ